MCTINMKFEDTETKFINIEALKTQESLEYPSNEAILSSGDGYAIFRFGGYNVRFKAPYSLERYLSVKCASPASPF